MAGGIFTDEKCPICARSGTKAKKIDTGKAISCDLHPEWKVAINLKVKMVFKGQAIQKRFKTYDLARRFLNALQVQVDEGKCDPRDYKRENPLGFQNLVGQWLKIKKNQNWNFCPRQVRTCRGFC